MYQLRIKAQVEVIEMVSAKNTPNGFGVEMSLGDSLFRSYM